MRLSEWWRLSFHCGARQLLLRKKKKKMLNVQRIVVAKCRTRQKRKWKKFYMKNIFREKFSFRCHELLFFFFLRCTVYSILVDVVCSLSFEKCDSYYVNVIRTGIVRTDGRDSNMYIHSGTSRNIVSRILSLVTRILSRS